MKLGFDCGACVLKFQSPSPLITRPTWLDMCERLLYLLPVSLHTKAFAQIQPFTLLTYFRYSHLQTTPIHCDRTERGMRFASSELPV